jgi:hypothetical protein
VDVKTKQVIVATINSYLLSAKFRFSSSSRGCQMAYLQTKYRNLDGLAMEVVGVFYGNLVYFKAI